MMVYLVRHGEANPDGERHLSPQGIKEVNSVSKKLLDKKIQIEEAFHSGKERAKETCEILANNLFKNVKITISNDLSPSSDISIWGNILNSENKNLLLVGHLPFLSDLTYYLIGDQIEFKTSEVVCLEKISSNKWKLCWKVKP
jgi:phosphohistidine phosphatase